MGVGEERTLEKYCPRKYEKSNPSQLSEINFSVMKEIFIRKKNLPFNHWIYPKIYNTH